MSFDIEEVNRILDKATAQQIEWVTWRVVLGTDKAASKRVGVHPKTVYSSSGWKRIKPDLDRAVELLRQDRAKGAMFALENLALEAVRALEASLGDKRHRVAAAREILSRVIAEKHEEHVTVNVDAAFNEALERAYGGTEVLNEPPEIPTNGKARGVSIGSGY